MSTIVQMLVAVSLNTTWSRHHSSKWKVRQSEEHGLSWQDRSQFSGKLKLKVSLSEERKLYKLLFEMDPAFFISCCTDLNGLNCDAAI